MPSVGGKKFPYTPSGEKAAAKEAKSTGKKMVKKPGKAVKSVPPWMK
jgi:hypothetical protein